MTKLIVEYLKVDELEPYERNSRIHNKEQIIQLSKSIKEFGFTNPIIIDENNMILAGHGRVEAFKLLDKTYFETGIDSIPCLRLHGLSLDQKKAYVIADNKIAENSEWNYELYMSELKYLNDIKFDLTTIGLEQDINFGNFSPNMNAMINADVTGKDLDSAQNKIDQAIQGVTTAKHKEGLEVICPKCKHEFTITGY